MIGGAGSGRDLLWGENLCVCPGFLVSSYQLGLSLYYFFIGTIYTVAGHCAKLNASCLRKGFFTLRKFAPAVEGLPYLHLTTGS